MARSLGLATAACAAATAAATAAAACYYYRQRQRSVGPRVVVASTSALKLAAVKAALGASEVTGLSAPSVVDEQPVDIEQIMKGASNRLTSITASAAEGHDYAVVIESGLVRLQCARPEPRTATHVTTRIARCSPDPQARVSPSSMRTGSLSGTGGPPQRWLDITVCVICNLRTGASSVASSSGLEFPTNFVGNWVEDGQVRTPLTAPSQLRRSSPSVTQRAECAAQDGTVGAVIAEQTGCDKQDPHAHLSGGAFPRSALLEQALRVAMATMPLGPPEAAPQHDEE